MERLLKVSPFFLNLMKGGCMKIRMFLMAIVFLISSLGVSPIPIQAGSSPGEGAVVIILAGHDWNKFHRSRQRSLQRQRMREHRRRQEQIRRNHYRRQKRRQQRQFVHDMHHAAHHGGCFISSSQE